MGQTTFKIILQVIFDFCFFYNIFLTYIVIVVFVPFEIVTIIRNKKNIYHQLFGWSGKKFEILSFMYIVNLVRQKKPTLYVNKFSDKY